MNLTLESLRSKRGQLVEQEVLNNILSTFYLCYHSLKALSTRRSNLIVQNADGTFNKKLIRYNVVNDIRKNKLLAYYNADGSVNIAIDKYNYYVFELQEGRTTNTHLNGRWLLHTFKEPSLNSIDIYAKRQLALKGYERKSKEEL